VKQVVASRLKLFKKKGHWREPQNVNTHKKTQKTVVPDGTPTDQAVARHEPSFEEIQLRAYETYVQRGRIPGFDLEDWLQAEKELKQKS
jgi:Protein of unknown function (DUF2934)